MSGAELDGKILGQMDDGCLGSGVSEGSVLAEGTDADAGNGRSHDNSGGVVDGGLFLEQGSESGVISLTLNSHSCGY